MSWNFSGILIEGGFADRQGDLYRLLGMDPDQAAATVSFKEATELRAQQKLNVAFSKNATLIVNGLLPAHEGLLMRLSAELPVVSFTILEMTGTLVLQLFFEGKCIRNFQQSEGKVLVNDGLPLPQEKLGKMSQVIWWLLEEWMEDDEGEIEDLLMEAYEISEENLLQTLENLPPYIPESEPPKVDSPADGPRPPFWKRWFGNK